MAALARRPPAGENNRPQKRQKVGSEQESLPNGFQTDNSVYGLSQEFDLQEALHRSLLDFKRQYEVSATHATTLEAKISSLEASNSALSASWTFLITNILSLFPASTSSLSTQLPDFSSHSGQLAAYDAALSAHAANTLSVVQGLLDSASTSARGQELDTLSRQYSTLTHELVATKHALALASQQLEQTRSDLASQADKLSRAEKALDRAKSQTLAQLDARLTTDDRIQEAVAAKASSQATSSTAVQEEKPAKIEEPVKPEPNGIYDQASNDIMTALNEARILADSRATQIEYMRKEQSQLVTEMDEFVAQSRVVAPEQVTESPEYTRLKIELEAANTDLVTALAALETSKEELNGLKQGQIELRETLLVDVAMQTDELNKRILARDADLNRIRAQREELRSENNELKAREAEKYKSVDAIRILANSKEDRMTALKSELRRLRMKIVADQGDMLAVDKHAATDIDEQLAQAQEELRLAKAAIPLADGQQTVSELQARTDQLQALVDGHEQLFGPMSTRSDLQELGARLQDRESRIHVLEANVKALENSSTMLVAEIERLSSAWQQLEEQTKNKLMHLVATEEKVTKITSEKSKADNRYFAAMRAKEALLAENQVLAKTLERHTKSIDTLNVTRSATLEQQVSLEKEISLLQSSLATHESQLVTIGVERDALTAQLASRDGQTQELSTRLKDRTAALESELAGRQQLEEQNGELQRRLDKMQEKEAADLAARQATAKPAMPGSSTGQLAELERYNADLNKMLKCTSCQMRYKSHVITRCYHLLCHECIEARLVNRQRKCPTCQMPFGQADVAQVFF